MNIRMGGAPRGLGRSDAWALLLLIAATTGCSDPVCGDGRREGGEECDDGNELSGDGCQSCRVESGFACDRDGCLAICGDGRTLGDEACDGSYCSDDCTAVVGACGDGVLQVGEGETCDDGNDAVEDGCDRCRAAYGFLCNPDLMTCTASGIASDRIFEDLTPEERNLLCDWHERLLRDRPVCDGLTWFYAGDAQCLEALELYPPRCTVRSLEEHAARAASWCAILDTPFECEPVCGVSPCDPVEGCGCGDGETCSVDNFGDPECVTAREPRAPRGQTCAGVGGCADGNLCVDVGSDRAFPICLGNCADDADCAEFAGPRACLRAPGREYGFCASGCDPLSPRTACTAGTDCRPIADSTGTSFVGICRGRPAFPRTEGTVCDDDLQCEAPLVCGRFVDGRSCARPCVRDGDCAVSGARCFAGDVPGFGFCGFPI